MKLTHCVLYGMCIILVLYDRVSIAMMLLMQIHVLSDDDTHAATSSVLPVL